MNTLTLAAMCGTLFLVGLVIMTAVLRMARYADDAQAAEVKRRGGE